MARCLVASVATTLRSRAELSVGVTLGKQARVAELSVVKTRAQKVSRRSGSPSRVETAGVGLAKVVTDTVVVPSEVSGGAATVDLTVNETVALRHRSGRWSAVSTTGGRAVLSRVVSEDELFRNTGRIPADGLCGWLALQWAASGVDYNPEWADLRVVENRERLCGLLRRLLVGCVCPRVRQKLGLVQTSLRWASAPWRLSFESGGWLDIGDIAHLTIDFPLVVWGGDVGDGHRRVRYPLSGNLPLERDEAGRLSVSAGQIILDCNHFFPVG